MPVAHSASVPGSGTALTVIVSDSGEKASPIE
jgi:hypothetical protein